MRNQRSEHELLASKAGPGHTSVKGLTASLQQDVNVRLVLKLVVELDDVRVAECLVYLHFALELGLGRRLAANLLVDDLFGSIYNSNSGTMHA